MVAAITPWNSPIASDAQKIAPALAAGNAVILKPSSWSPLVSLELARIVEAAGLPKGLFSVLPGGGGEIGELLVTHPDIGRVSFTGGTATGRRIAVKAAEKLMPVSLELGGKSPTIVFEDCDVDVAVAGILFGIFSSTGQSCIAGSRLFVQASIFDEFLTRLLAATNRLVVGHPHDPQTQMAPLIHPDHRDQIEAMVERAKADGAEVLTGGERPSDPALSGGIYYLPTILSGLPNDAEICREEVFGPVLTVLPFDDETQVIDMANDNEYGLAAGLWSPRFSQMLARRQSHPRRHGVDQHLQAVFHFDALRRRQGKRHRPRKGSRGHARLYAPEGHVCGSQRRAASLGATDKRGLRMTLSIGIVGAESAASPARSPCAGPAIG